MKKILVFILTFIVVAFIVNVLFDNLEKSMRLSLAMLSGLLLAL